jgi:hypothetical protein
MNINKKTALSLQQELSDPDGLTVFKLMSIIIDYYTSDSTEVSFEDQDYANLDHKKHMISNFKNFVDDYQAENKEDEDSCELFSQELGKPNFFINIIILLIL